MKVQDGSVRPFNNPLWHLYTVKLPKYILDFSLFFFFPTFLFRSGDKTLDFGISVAKMSISSPPTSIDR